MISLVDTVDAVHGEIDYIRDRVCKWSAKVGDFRINGKRIKEWFVLPGQNISTWWFGLISEKNTAKTDAFLLIAQLRAIKRELGSNNYDVVVISVENEYLIHSLKDFARSKDFFLKILKVNQNKSFKEALKNSVILNPVFEIVSASMVLLKTTFQSILVKSLLGPLKKRMPDKKSMMFVNYFPAVDEKSAGLGEFRNKYAMPVQDKCMEIGLPIFWVMMYVPIYGYNYKDAVNLASLFVKNGEKMVFIEEFLDLKTIFRCFFLWIGQIFQSFYILKRAKESLFSDPFIKESRFIIDVLWHRSFCGSTSMEGILYYYIFRNLFERINKICGCLYYCEMHAWEKALNAAKRDLVQDFKTIGYQHAILPMNLFSYFYDKTETELHRMASDMPLPDILAASGELTYSLLLQSGYPGLIKLEAVRYIYLNDILRKNQTRKSDRNCLLVTGSISKKESIALLTLVYEAFKNEDEIEILLKGHPAMPFENLINDMKIQIEKTGLRIVKEELPYLLKSSAIVIVPSSSVALEALAYGCEVIVPFSPDMIQMNPLADFNFCYHKITSYEDLKRVVKNIKNEKLLNDPNLTADFINKYWDLNPSLPGWLDLLKSFKICK